MYWILEALIPFVILYGHWKLRTIRVYQYGMEVLTVCVLLLYWFIAVVPHRLEGFKVGYSLIFR
jgi:hypothetical protein